MMAENTLELIPPRTGASMRRGRSKQDYATPREFIAAVEERFGSLHFDLAASADNAVTNGFYDIEADALARDWAKELGASIAWLNPPFANIDPWAERCARYASPRLKILFLTPASVGSNWFAAHVHGKAMVLGLSPRLSFSDEPYPKDCILSAFGFGVHGFDVWRWR